MQIQRLDLRQREPAARAQLRRTLIRFFKRGPWQSAIAREWGLRRSTVAEWVGKAKAGQELQEGRRGRPLGHGRRLTSAQEARLQKDLVDKPPDQWKLRFARWNAPAVRALIKAHCGINLPVRTLHLYLNRWGFTPQRPLQRAFEHKPAAVRQGLHPDYPAIAARAKAEEAEIHWGDQPAGSSVEHYPRGYAPKGKTPIRVLSQAKRERLNLLSAIRHRGTVRLMLSRDPVTGDRRLKVLERLIRQAGRKVFLILDNRRVHHAAKVKTWLADKTEQIELFLLPSYSPELHPDEDLNADLTAGLNAAEAVRGSAHLKRKVVSHLGSIQQQPARVRSYFKADPIRYAA